MPSRYGKGSRARQRGTPTLRAVALLLAATCSCTASTGLNGLFAQRQPLILTSETVTSSSYILSNSTSSQVTVVTTPTENLTPTGESGSNRSGGSLRGRYGHSAVYLPAKETIYYFGGQVGDNATQLTNEILAFNLRSSFLWGENRPEITAISDNPSLAVDLMTRKGRIPAQAWSAVRLVESVTSEDLDQVWFIGGVTADCEKDSLVYTLDATNLSWSTTKLSPRSPARRRQAKAVSIFNTTTQLTDLYVLGGIAEQTTCSEQLSGYIGIDRYQIPSNKSSPALVESFGWDAPLWGNRAGEGWTVPVSDYTVNTHANKTSLVVIGGQDPNGNLPPMDEILVFDSISRTWTLPPAEGDVPPARMGHVAVTLASGSILIHGGLNQDEKPLSSLYLLTPPAVSAPVYAPWTWSLLSISNDSLRSPALAWHTANLISDGQIVVGFGIDTISAKPTNKFKFLTIDEDLLEFSWSEVFTPITPDPRPDPRVVTAAVRAQVVENPKAHTEIEMLTTTTETTSRTTTTSSSIQIIPTMSSFASSIAETSSFINTWASDSVSSQDFTVSPSKTQSARVPTNTATDPFVLAQAEAEQAAAQKRTRTILASVGTFAGLIGILGLAVLILRRRAARNLTPIQPEFLTGNRDGFNPVSTLLLTRPVHQRMLSLGSTLSPNLSEPGSTKNPNLPQSLGKSADPFSDSHTVDELGQLSAPRAANSAASRTNSLLAALTPSLASATSIPFLAALQRTESNETFSDRYTIRPNSLGSKRSIRSLREQSRDQRGTPGSPAVSDTGASVESHTSTQEFGVAVSVGETPLPPFLEFRAPTNSSESNLYFSEGNMRSSTPSRNEGIPSALRPGTPGRIKPPSRTTTPLRVMNADPFQDA